jgi:O-methyltransferase involved in polyketide biosynthesis
LAWDAMDAAASGVMASRGNPCVRSLERARRTALKRTAKACGPGTRCWCQVPRRRDRLNRTVRHDIRWTTVARRIRRREYAISCQNHSPRPCFKRAKVTGKISGVPRHEVATNVWIPPSLSGTTATKQIDSSSSGTMDCSHGE